MRKTILLLGLFCLFLSVPVEMEGQIPLTRPDRTATTPSSPRNPTPRRPKPRTNTTPAHPTPSTPQPSADDSRRKILDRLVSNMVYVEGGTFMMGANPGDSEAYDKEKPHHQVTLSSFSIGKYEVTQEEWEAVMGSNPSSFKGKNRPVEQVSWNDCQEFIRKLNSKTGKQFRLPTEAEWEYAARGGKRSQGYKYSGSNSVEAVAWYYGNSGDTTHDVGQKSPNELGLYDMTGNVHELCQDFYDNYSSSTETNPTGPTSGSFHVCRGNSFASRSKGCRVSYRMDATADDCNELIGFRLALSE